MPSDLYSLTIIDKSNDPMKNEDTSHRIKYKLIDYFNLGINEYQYPQDTELGDYIQQVVKDLNQTGTGLRLVPYNDITDHADESQAMLIMTENKYDNSVSDIVDSYRHNHFIDFIFY